MAAFAQKIAVDFSVMDHILSVLISWDVQTFFAINHGASSPVLDIVMPFLTTTKNWLPIYFFGLLVLIGRGYRQRHADGPRLIACAIILILTVAIADQLSHQLLKETIQRPRPYAAMSDVIQLVGSGGGSFPSNHAMNSAIIAIVLTTFFPRYRQLWWSYAGIIGLSRVYCGVHYPSDVLGGLLIGALVARLVVHVLQKQWPQLPIGPPPPA